MTQRILSVLIAFFIFSITGCQQGTDPQEVMPVEETSTGLINKEEVALQVVDLLNEKATYTKIIASLKNNKAGVSLSTLLNDVNGMPNKAASKLKGIVKNAEDRYANDLTPDVIEVPELWLLNSSNKVNEQDLLVSFVPEGDEKDWTQVKAYTLDGEVVYLDAKKQPEVPVVVVETNGFQALQVKAEKMNEMLKAGGLQYATPSKETSKAEGLETTKLNKIELLNDEEPWIKGGAEVYAITSGIRTSKNEAEIQIIPMYYLEEEEKAYYPNQILLVWDDYAYQAANIQFFEHDNNHNYKELVQIIIKGVLEITGTLTGEVWLIALGEIAGAIVGAMPDDWFTDDDDYIDSFYTIEKNKSYTDYYGVRGNAKLSMAPFFVPVN